MRDKIEASSIIIAENVATKQKAQNRAKQQKRENLSFKLQNGTADEQKLILTWLADKRFATTSQVARYLVLGDAATHRLRELEQAGVLDSSRYEPYKGRNSEKVYWLSYSGTRLCENIGIEGARYESRFVSDPPGVYQVHYRTLELELPFLARQAGWRVIEPKKYNSVHPKGEKQTRQATALANAVHLLEESRIEGLRKSGKRVDGLIYNFNLKKHLEIVPRQCNHHVCYIPGTAHVLLFILCPEDITRQFWKARIKEYGDLPKKVNTFGVFYTTEQGTSWIDYINDSGIGVVSLPNLPALIADYTPQQLS